MRDMYEGCAMELWSYECINKEVRSLDTSVQDYKAPYSMNSVAYPRNNMFYCMNKLACYMHKSAYSMDRVPRLMNK